MMKKGHSQIGPSHRWWESLRPDDVTHARLSRQVRREAEPLLMARRAAAGWEGVAARWAVLLAPVAAVLAIVFAGLAHQAGTGGRPSATTGSVTVEQLVEVERDEEFPALLTSASEPSKDHLFAEAIAARGRQP